MAMTSPALEVADLVVTFALRGREYEAVSGVSFSLAKGEVLCLVGESGSGKSVTGLAILGLVHSPGRIASGSVRLEGEELTTKSEEQLRAIRGKRLAMIFQDPMGTLNPVLRIDTQIIEAILAHDRVSQRAARARAREALTKVGIASPDERLANYPHQLSGGMRQRIAIAIALLHRPTALIADEPTTALDVTIQAQFLSEVQTLAEEEGTALLWITHDLAVAAGLADRIAVMYAGKLVETGSVQQVIERPAHPYTAGLVSCAPSRNLRGVPLVPIPGMAPSLAQSRVGCAFAPRCARADAACEVAPELVSLPDGRVHRCVHPLVSYGTDP